MIDQKTIQSINAVIQAYFEQNATQIKVRAKDLMPDFIKAGIFKKDEKHGMPIRQILRELDRDEKLQSIPYVYADRNDQNINWYFVPSASVISELTAEKEITPTKKELALKKRLESDEAYVIDLCDTVLGVKAERHKRFHFLLGDFHKDGVTRTKLPVDAYYESLNLVVEFVEVQQPQEVDDLETPYVRTISGLSRADQRLKYDERRAEVLPDHGITLITFDNIDFTCDSNNKIVRNMDSDIKIVKERLKEFK